MDTREIILLLTGLFVLLKEDLVIGADQNECVAQYCGHQEIRFPFRLIGIQPKHCGYPGFDLNCTEGNEIIFNLQIPVEVSTKNVQLQYSAKVLVDNIDYQLQHVIFTYSGGGCLEPLSLATFPMELAKYSPGYTLFNCSISKSRWILSQVGCLDRPGYMVYAADSSTRLYKVSLSSCSKMYNISSPDNLFFGPVAYRSTIIWNRSICGDCEAQGKFCRFQGNSKGSETECFNIPVQSKGSSKKLIVAGIILGVFLGLLFFIALCYVLISYTRKKYDQEKIEMFLEDYRELKPRRYTYADIKKITNQFQEKLGQGGYGIVYKGNLSKDVLVAVKVLNASKGNGEDFINEVGTIGRIHHINVVRLIGYCADGFRRALVYEFLPNDTLHKFLSSENCRREILLNWEKLQGIAIGIAKGIEYLHQGCDQQILHFDIKPQNVLMDEDFNPKIVDFGLAKLCSKDDSAVSITLARGTIGYIAPEVFSRNFGKVSYKSDVYSFGMVLLDMVGARKGNDEEENTSEVYFLERTYNSLVEGDELGFQVEINGDPRITKKLTIIGLWCIQWFPADRPSMRTVIQMLEGEDCPVVPPNPFASMGSQNAPASSSLRRRTMTMDLESISEME